MKILIFGSTYLSAIATEYLVNQSDYEIVGHVPNKKRITIPGKMTVPVVSEDSACDVILSLNYDQKIKNTDKSFNVHTGLLPEYGGVDIFYHTIKNKPLEQGLTFHKITKFFDYGPIISKITYPVLPEDTIDILYKRMTKIFPLFVLSSLKLLENIPWDDLTKCPMIKPKIYTSSEISEEDVKGYHETGIKLKELFKT